MRTAPPYPPTLRALPIERRVLLTRVSKLGSRSSHRTNRTTFSRMAAIALGPHGERANSASALPFPYHSMLSEVGARMKSLEETLLELENSTSSQSTSGMMPLTVPFEVDFGAFWPPTLEACRPGRRFKDEGNSLIGVMRCYDAGRLFGNWLTRRCRTLRLPKNRTPLRPSRAGEQPSRGI